ncbi:Aste57867_2694 [Aphanomyces stellatus]|uniref:subtilisin n=1 Tax=Aphanomyces stellatus TaxID=120398 RepID=A0A485K8V2_9STRA|nr:hypothetical protein As57867_002687 [Aphanomyces stellatus]VFT79887.1 Aste57867_2694 [Aphanomyces stellatus]
MVSARTAIFAAAVAAASVQAKIHPRLLREMAANDGAVGQSVVVEFVSSVESALEKADSQIEAIQSRGAKIESILTTLNTHAATSQAEALAVIDQARTSRELTSDFSAQTLSIANILVLDGASKPLLDKLATVASVKAIRPQYFGKLVKATPDAIVAANATVEWGVERIGTKTLWDQGFRGKGIVVGGIDTGVRGTHEALKGNWRAENGYFQPKGNGKLPTDQNGHGTHTMGTSVGQFGVGVAPDAKWISCEGCLPDDTCPEKVLVACAQYMLCPHDFEGKNPKCELAPHVINNSWGDDDEIPDVPYYKGPVAAWRKAGIIPVFANANSGPKCGSVLSPGDYPNVIGVGATTITEELASFSSRGPTNKTQILKPDVSAPGRTVRSAYNKGDDAYASLSGTSMATPHVVGAVALLISAKPGITYDEIYKALTTTAVRDTLKSSNQTCGGIPDTIFPNNNFGYGRIDVAKAAGAAPTPTTTRPAC